MISGTRPLKAGGKLSHLSLTDSLRDETAGAKPWPVSTSSSSSQEYAAMVQETKETNCVLMRRTLLVMFCAVWLASHFDDQSKESNPN